MATASASMSVVVIGGTGATGKQLVRALVSAPERYSRVTLIGRRKVTLPEEYGVDLEKAESDGRVVQHTSPSLDEVSDETVKQLCEGSHAFFCVLGTTRRAAGSAAAFYHLDCEVVVRYAKLAKEAGVKHFSLLTSAGSNPNSWFLYTRTKGEAEQGVRELKFPRTSIFRPGLLDRGQGQRRFGEKLVSLVMRPLSVADLAKAMEQDAYDHFSSAGEPSATAADEPVVEILTNADIRRIVGQTAPAQPKKETEAKEASTEGKGTEGKPAETEEATTEAEGKASEETATEGEPAEDKGEPAEDKATEGEPAEDKATEGEPTEDKATEGEPSEDKATEGEPSEDKATEGEPSEDKATEGEPSEDKATEGEPSEDKATEGEPTEEKTTEEGKANEETATEEKPAEEKVEETNEEPATEKEGEGTATEEATEEEQSSDAPAAATGGEEEGAGSEEKEGKAASGDEGASKEDKET